MEDEYKYEICTSSGYKYIRASLGLLVKINRNRANRLETEFIDRFEDTGIITHILGDALCKVRWVSDSSVITYMCGGVTDLVSNGYLAIDNILKNLNKLEKDYDRSRV